MFPYLLPSVVPAQNGFRALLTTQDAGERRGEGGFLLETRREAEKAVLRVPGFLVGDPRAKGTRGAGT